MTTEHQTTPEEEAYRRLLDEIWEKHSEPTRAVIEEAESAAYAANMVRSYCFQWHFEYDEAMDKVRLATVGLTDDEHKLLAKFWRAALAAAASIDPEDFESLAGYRVYSGNVHSYYRMLSGMIEDILQEKRTRELRDERVGREPEDLTDPPF